MRPCWSKWMPRCAPNWRAFASEAGTSSNQKYILTGYVTNLTNKAYKKLELIPSYGAYPVLYGDPRVFGLTFTAKI